MNFPKHSGFWSPDSDQALDYAKRYIPAGILLGAGGAGIVHLLAKMRELKKEQEVQAPGPDTLTVPIPTPAVKMAASTNPFGILSQVGSRSATSIRGSKILDSLGGAWKFLAKDHPWRGVAALGAAGYGGAVAANSVNAPKAVGDSIWDAAAPVALTGGSALLSYGLVNNLLQNREKKQLQERLDRAKDQYGTMLGQTLSSANASKVAGLDGLFPTIHGICLGLVDNEFPGHEKEATTTGSLLFTAGLTGLPTIAAILAHKWMYQRQMEVDALHQTERPKPPKQIRLVSVPAQPQPQLENAEDEERQLALPAPKMANELPEILGAVMASQALKGEGKKEEKPVRRQGAAPMPRSIDIAPGTSQITTSEGPVEVEAQDPRAAAIMASGGTRRLTQLLSIFQAQPAISGVEQPASA